MTTPSVGICSPGRTFMRSPTVIILQWHFHFDTVLVDEGGRLGLHFEEFPKGVTCLPFRRASR